MTCDDRPHAPPSAYVHENHSKDVRRLLGEIDANVGL